MKKENKEYVRNHGKQERVLQTFPLSVLRIKTDEIPTGIIDVVIIPLGALFRFVLNELISHLRGSVIFPIFH